MHIYYGPGLVDCIAEAILPEPSAQESAGLVPVPAQRAQFIPVAAVQVSPGWRGQRLLIDSKFQGIQDAQ